MFGRYSCLIVGGRKATTLSLKLIGNEQVDPVWFSLSLLIDPFKIYFWCLRCVRHRTKNAESTRVLHVSDNSRQWVKANSGKSIPKRSYRADFIYLFLFGLVLR